jgi:RNA polymerase sigma-70 factor, ECF subfamily
VNETPADSRPESSRPGSISSTLLERVKARRPEAWERLVDLYGPVVYRWCRQSGVAAEDSADVVQEVFLAVAAHIADFRRNGPGDRFDAWLGTITRNKIRDLFRRRRGRLSAQGGTDAQTRFLDLPEPSGTSLSSSPADADGLLSRRALDLVRAEFENRTWEAFWRTAVEGQSPGDVAAELGMTVPAVYKAKSRVLRRLRQELGGLL